MKNKNYFYKKPLFRIWEKRLSFSIYNSFSYSVSISISGEQCDTFWSHCDADVTPDTNNIAVLEDPLDKRFIL